MNGEDSMGKIGAVIGALFVILVLCVVSYGALQAHFTDLAGANTVRVAEANARTADALAREREAAAREQEAQNAQALYDAAGYAIVTQADLVDYYARRGDARAREIWEWIAGIATVVFLVLYPNWTTHGSAKAAPQNTPAPQWDKEG